MLRRPLGEKAAQGKNLSPASARSPLKALKPAGPPQVEPPSSEMTPRTWARPPSRLSQTTTNALPPSSLGLGSPTRLGKLLQRNAVPPRLSSQKPWPVPEPSAPTLLMSVMRGSIVWLHEAPPSEDSSCLSSPAWSQLHQATISSPLASKAGLVPLPHRLSGKLMALAAANHDAPPSSV